MGAFIAAFWTASIQNLDHERCLARSEEVHDSQDLVKRKLEEQCPSAEEERIQYI